MKRSLTHEFIYQIFALLLAIIVVHIAYVGLIRPQADAILAHQKELQDSGEDYVPSYSLYVIMRDYEQEACFVLMIWAFAIMGYKGRFTLKDRKLLEKDLLNIAPGMSILPEDARELSRPLQALPEEDRETLLPRALLTGLLRFSATRSIQDVSSAIKETCESEANRLDSELAMIRYIAWAIPSLGFIGTVRGIGLALGEAHRAVEGDIAGVTANLGTAFNSTFVALVISIVLMFLMQQLQLMQERFVLDSQNYCNNKLINFLKLYQA